MQELSPPPILFRATNIQYIYFYSLLLRKVGSMLICNNLLACDPATSYVISFLLRSNAPAACPTHIT
jgi:hypothetical protein